MVHTKSELAVCIGVTSDLSFAAFITFLNFAELHDIRKTKFYLYSDRNLRNATNVAKRAGLNVEVIKYKPPISWSSLWSAKSIRYFSPLVLSKFEIFSLLEHHDQVLWLDYDILIQEPLRDVIGNKTFDIAYMHTSFDVRKGFIDAPKGESFDLKAPGMSAGIIIANSSIEGYESVTSELYELFLKHSKNLFFPEQAIFDIYLQRMSFTKKILGNEYSAYPESPDAKDALILHSWGSKKFWLGLQNDSWEAGRDRWTNMGGSNFSKAYSYYSKSGRFLRYFIASFLMKTFRNFDWGN